MGEITTKCFFIYIYFLLLLKSKERKAEIECVEYETMSPLSIVSQSFAITTAITAGLFSFVSFFLDWSGDKQDHNSLSGDDSMPNEIQLTEK